MWTNKHVIVAMLVAPVLAIIAWVGVDYIVAERAEPARPGETYSLVAKPDCRREGGVCNLTNSEFELTIQAVASSGNQTVLTLGSRFPLSDVRLSMVHEGQETFGVSSTATLPGNDAQLIVAIPALAYPNATLRIVVNVQQSIYFAEVSAIFVQPRAADEEGL